MTPDARCALEEPRLSFFFFQCRGWGADMAPPHINELYMKQMDVYEQAKKRESLKALSLAITTPRYQKRLRMNP